MLQRSCTFRCTIDRTAEGRGTPSDPDRMRRWILIETVVLERSSPAAGLEIRVAGGEGSPPLTGGTKRDDRPIGNRTKTEYTTLSLGEKRNAKAGDNPNPGDMRDQSL